MTTLELEKQTPEVVYISKTPSWVKFVISSLVGALLLGLISTYAGSSGQDAKIESNSKAVSNLYAIKANEDEVDRNIQLLQKRLDRMEDKLDRIIENQRRNR